MKLQDSPSIYYLICNGECSYLVKGFIFNGDLSLSMCQFLGLWWNTALLLIWCFGPRLSRFIKTIYIRNARYKCMGLKNMFINIRSTNANIVFMQNLFCQNNIIYTTCMNILFKMNKIYKLHSSKGIIATDAGGWPHQGLNSRPFCLKTKL